MRLLVIDNLTVEMPELNQALSKYSYDIINYQEINATITKGYDKIILSGGHAFTVLYPNKKYKNELNLIKECEKPILGICLGFQLICRAYGTNMSRLKIYEKGVLNIEKIKQDILLKEVPNSFYVFESHHNVVKKTSKDLVPLAVSKDGIEIVRHISKPIWGTQFHPEHFKKKSIGRRIIRNFVEL